LYKTEIDNWQKFSGVGGLVEKTKEEFMKKKITLAAILFFLIVISGFMKCDKHENKHPLKKYTAADVTRIAQLSSSIQAQEMKDLLAADHSNIEPSLRELVFMNAARLRPVLRTLLTDQQVALEAASLLSFIGIPEDVRFVVHNAPKPETDELDTEFAYYYIVTALLDPQTEEEWNFLKKCAGNEFDYRWAVSGAIQTLQLIANQRSVAILKELQNKNVEDDDSVLRALGYINSKPSALSDKNVIMAAKKVAEAIKIGNWEGNGKPRYNHDGDMALVDCIFVTGRCASYYTATFQSKGGIWILRGVRETIQELRQFQ
jgi:hypothetical protein